MENKIEAKPFIWQFERLRRNSVAEVINGNLNLVVHTLLGDTEFWLDALSIPFDPEGIHTFRFIDGAVARDQRVSWRRRVSQSPRDFGRRNTEHRFELPGSLCMIWHQPWIRVDTETILHTRQHTIAAVKNSSPPAR